MLNVKKTITKILEKLESYERVKQTVTLLGFFKNLNGGIYKIGDLYLVNFIVYVDGTFAANDYYTMATGLPPASVNSALTVTTANNAGNRRAVATISDTGALVIQSGDLPLTHYTLFVTGIYLGGGN